MDTRADTVARLLESLQAGDRAALDALVPVLYDELRRVARGQMRRERAAVTLQPTALVHEAWVRLAASRALAPRDRTHFVAIAARVMRQVLVEHARARGARKREGGRQRVTLDEAMLRDRNRSIDVEALDEALTRLAARNPEHARIVELRFFGGLSVEEVAEVLGSSPATVKRRWTLAKAWLLGELHSA